MSNNIVDYPPGTYTMRVTGTSGAKSDSFTIDLVLVNPCFTVDLGIQTNPFPDSVYVLRDPEIALAWQAVDLIQPATTVDCGSISVEFFNDDIAKSALAVPFKDDRATTPDNFFRVLYSEDVGHKGSYPFRYRVYHTDYPLNSIEQ